MYVSARKKMHKNGIKVNNRVNFSFKNDKGGNIVLSA